MNEIREKQHRLPPSAYQGYIRASFTANIDDRTDYFVTPEIFAEHEAHLLRALREHHCDSELYLFMPDHVHIVVTGTDPSSDVRAAMTKFKQYSGFWLSKYGNGVRWQKDFYDHVFREDDDLRKHMIYILNNPIRAGLCGTWREYPFRGSTVFDLKSWR
jgi:putative transposase